MIKFKTSSLTKNGVIAVLAIFCCLLWASAFPCIKIGYQLFEITSDDVASQILFAGCRFTLAGILVVIMGSLLKGHFLKPSRNAIPKIFKLCLLQTVLQYFFFYVGLANTTGVKGSIITASNTFIAIFVSCLFFKMESLNAKKILGCLLGFIGVIIVNLSGQSGGLSFNLMGDGFILCSATAYGFSSVLIKRYSQTEDPVMLSGYQFMAGGLIMVIASLLAGGKLDTFTTGGCLLLFYMALLSAVAYTLWGILLKYNPVSKVTVYGFFNPVFGVILSTIILDEGGMFGIQGLLALLLVCVGILIVNYEKADSK